MNGLLCQDVARPRSGESLRSVTSHPSAQSVEERRGTPVNDSLLGNDFRSGGPGRHGLARHLLNARTRSVERMHSDARARTLRVLLHAEEKK